MKIKVKGYINNITDESKTVFSTSAIKTKNKISYILNNDKYILNILSPKKLILVRENNEMKSTIYFEKNKTISSLYTLKEKDITLEIDIKTLDIKVEEKQITITYLVKDSNNKYEYNIEMSD